MDRLVTVPNIYNPETESQTVGVGIVGPVEQADTLP